MTDKFDEVFADAFIPLQQLFNHEIPPDILKIYHSHLKARMTPEAMARACLHVLDNFKPTAACGFPAPAHFIEYGLGSPETRATAALAKIRSGIRDVGRYDGVDFGDMALHRTIDQFGGWVALCDWTHQDWDMNTRRFRDTYMMEEARESSDGRRYLPGQFEIDDAKYKISGDPRFPERRVMRLSDSGIVLRLANSYTKPKEIKNDGPEKISVAS